MTLTHYRRKILKERLKTLYENNFKDSANWSFEKMERMIRFYNVVKSKEEEQTKIPDEKSDPNQLTIF